MNRYDSGTVNHALVNLLDSVTRVLEGGRVIEVNTSITGNGSRRIRVIDAPRA